MTSAIDIIEYLRTRDRSLRSSRFDGQAAVLELVKEVQGLPEAQSEEFFAALLQLIEQSDPELMAFAIEYLVHERSGEGASHLGQLVALADQTEVWFQPALLGLLRVGYRPIQELALKHLERHWAERGFPLALLTQLVSVAPTGGVRLGASFLSSRLPSATGAEFESIGQAFVNGYLRHNPDCLVDLMRSSGVSTSFR